MGYYPSWIDYAGWSFVVVGALFAFAMMPEPTGRKRGFLKLAACELIAIGIGFLGTGGVLFNLRAPELSAHGTVAYTIHHRGKGSSTTFTLRLASGEIVVLHISPVTDRIRNGETAEVEYQGGSYAALNVRILAGPYAGYEATAPNGMTGAVFTLLGALGLGLFGIMNWMSDGTATPSQPDDQPAPDGEVDTKSMLNLSSNDA